MPESCLNLRFTIFNKDERGLLTKCLNYPNIRKIFLGLPARDQGVFSGGGKLHGAWEFPVRMKLYLFAYETN